MSKLWMWSNIEDFSRDYRACEAVYNRTVSDLDIRRAWERYLSILRREQ